MSPHTRTVRHACHATRCTTGVLPTMVVCGPNKSPWVVLHCPFLSVGTTDEVLSPGAIAVAWHVRAAGVAYPTGICRRACWNGRMPSCGCIRPRVGTPMRLCHKSERKHI